MPLIDCLIQREAEREAARLSAIRDAEKQAFEEKEAAAAAELQQRVEIEQKTIAEQQRRARAELERQRRLVIHLLAYHRLKLYGQCASLCPVLAALHL